WRQRDRQQPGGLHQGALGDAVRDAAAGRAEGGCRSDVDDHRMPVAMLAHPYGRGARDEEGAFQIDVEDVVPDFFGHSCQIGEGNVARSAGAADQDVEPAVLLNYGLYQAIALLDMTDVGPVH